MVAMRDSPRSGHSRPDDDDAVMRRDDQAIELVVGVVGEREHHPVLAALARAHLDAADNAVGAGRGGNLDAVGVAVLVIEYGGEIDCGRVSANADSVERRVAGRGGKNHEAQRQQRKASDQAQCRFSAINTHSRASMHRPACRDR